MPNNSYTQNFQEAISRLNSNQKKAVNAIDGCVMVIAGPGSGKTQILSLRIANILEQTDAIPSSILCLTFTDNASYNMKLRLGRFLGQQASKVNIFTFHSFAKYIMEQFPEYFFLGSYLKPLDPINKLLLVEQILESLSMSYVIGAKGLQDEFVYINSIISNIAEIKKFGLNPNQFTDVVKENQDYLDDNGTKIEELLSIESRAKNIELIKSGLQDILGNTKGKTSQVDVNMLSLEGIINGLFTKTLHELQDSTKTTAFTELKKKLSEKGTLKERKVCQKNLELAHIYNLYQIKIRTMGFYDYEDMILEVVAELKRNEELRLILQERYQYILVDEFQDTNLAQMELVDGLLNMEITENNPNLFVVGDEDQCIYKFQGAEIENLLLFKAKFPKVEVITMTENYRSNQAILDFASGVIDSSSTRLSNSPEFSFVNKKLVSMI